MPSVVALYRYPVKGFAPEPSESLTVREDGRIEGDRVLGFRFASTPEADDAWSSKHGMLALVNTPGLARLRIGFDTEAMRLRMHVDGLLLADEALDAAGRRRICEAVADFAMAMAPNALDGHPERLPLRLVGDGRMPRYHDSPAGKVSLHGRASLAALATALDDPSLDERRFRSNVAVDGIEAWEEHAWAGRQLRIGGVRLQADKPMVRCLATHANPATGERDRPVMTTLTRVVGQEDPIFAISLRPLGAGTIYLQDEIVLE
jgi:uncharacterized protein YcbX